MVSARQVGPDPVSARTPAEFVQLLREVRSESQLSFWDIQRRAHDHGYDLEPAVVVHALGQPGLPDWQIVVGLLTSCGYQGMQIDRWMRVYRDLAEAGQQFHEPGQHLPRHELEEEPEAQAVPPLPAMHRSATSGSSRRYVLVLGAAVAVAAFTLLIVNMRDNDPSIVAGPGTSATPAPQGSDPTTVLASPTAESASPVAKTTASPGPQPPGASPGVLRAGTVTLTGGQGVDLDTGQPSGNGDVVAASGTALEAGDNAKRLGLVSGMPSQQTCESIIPGRLDRDVTGLAAGQWLCVRTSSGHWARVNVTATGSSLKLAYTVWT